MPVIDKAGVLEILSRQPNATKRDLTKLLGIKGSDRIELKRTLKELTNEGAIKGNRRVGYAAPGALPEVAVLEITGQDTDGELLALPQKWINEEPPVASRRDDAGLALGRGERVWRGWQGRNGLARVIKRLGADAQKVLGVLMVTPNGLRLAPIDRKNRTEYAIDNRDRGGAEHNELVLAEPIAGRAAGFPRARVIERLGNMSSPKTVSLIAIHAHGIPTEFPEVIDEHADAADLRGRTDLRTLRSHHRPRGRARP